VRKQLNGGWEGARIIEMLKERPYTMGELAAASGKTFSATRVLVDTLSLDYPVAQKGKKYFIPEYDVPEYIKELADEYKLLEYNEDTGKYEIIGKKIDFVRFYVRREYKRIDRLIPYKKLRDVMRYVSGFNNGVLRRFYYIVAGER
jgi:hypothetical protein